jgi:hypothetical protein
MASVTVFLAASAAYKVEPGSFAQTTQALTLNTRRFTKNNSAAD